MKKTLLLAMLLAAGFSATAQVAGDDLPLADGSIAPDFTAPDIYGGMHSLYQDYLDQGKSVVIDFSATWCAPCWAYHQTHAMADFYEAYGPAGSNEIGVIFVEGDVANTTTANLFGEQGPIAPSQGNWTLHSPYPIIEDTEALDLGAANKFDVEYFPTMYVICQGSHTTISADQMTPAQLKSTINGGCQTLTGIPNHGRIDQASTLIRLCSAGEAVNLQAKLKNFGNNTITSATVVLKENGNVLDTKNYTGNAINQFANPGTITFNNVVLNATSTYTFELMSINGVATTNPELTVVPVTFQIAQEAPNNHVEVKIYTDNYPSEATWQIKDSAGTTVASGGPYQAGTDDQWGGGGPDANTVKTQVVDLPGDSPECFTVVLFDQFNDGWNYGSTPHGVQIVSDGTVVYENLNVGSFGSSFVQTKAFRAMGVLGNEEVIAEGFAMYPNPTTGLLNFTTLEPVDVTILDLTGKVVHTAKGIENGGSVNLGSLQSGMYIAQIKGATTQRVEKIVLE